VKKKHDLSAENHEKTPVEINVARWSIFATHQTRGYRKLPPRTEMIDGQNVTRQVSIGTWRDTNKTLNPFDQDVFVTIYGQWERDGCDMNNRKVLGSISQTIFDLEDKKRQSNINEKEIIRIKESLDRMATISIIYDEAYENSSGYSTKTITLLKHVKVFDRKKSLAMGEGYYEPTELELNEDICRNIKDEKFIRNSNFISAISKSRSRRTSLNFIRRFPARQRQSAETSLVASVAPAPSYRGNP